MPKYSKAGRKQAELYAYFAYTHLHNVGNDAYYGTPFMLEDWQLKNIWMPVFARGRVKGGKFRRRYRRVLIGEPRDYGKTALAVVIMLTIANMEPVYNGQYGIIASSRPQAKKILGTLKAMVAMDPDLRSIWECMSYELRNRETGASIVVFPYDEAAVQSWHFNLVICDELHVWKDSTVWDAIISGQKSIPDALAIGITTASSSRSGFLWQLLEDIKGKEDALTVWIGAKDTDRMDDEKVWARLAMPSWVSVDDIRQQYDALTRRSFERYVLNRFPAEKSADRALRTRDLNACRKMRTAFDDTRPFTLAVDGATSGDAFAIVAHQVDDAGIDQFKTWIYDEPGEKGYYELNQIEQLIAGLCQRYRCPVGIDPARLLLMATQLQDDYGVEIYEIRQDNKTMCSACSLITNSVRAHTAALGGLDKLAEHLSNCRELEREPYGVRYTSVRHGQGTERIDGAIAAAMAKWMTTVMPESLSFADSGGIWLV